MRSSVRCRTRASRCSKLHDLLTELLAQPAARTWLLERRLRPQRVGGTLAREMRSWFGDLPARDLAERLIGGVARAELPFDAHSLLAQSLGPSEFVLDPLPNTLFTRDSSCWIGAGVTLNPMYWPARREETLLIAALVRFHPAFAGTQVWWGDADAPPGSARSRAAT